MKKRTARAGFTLIELIVAISVIGILASIVIISYANWQNSIIAAQLKSDLNGAASAMESARTFNNSYPTLISNLTTFKPSKNITLTGGSSDGVVYCIDAISSQNANIHYFIDQNSRSQGAQLGTCSSRSVPVLTATATSISTINLSWTSVPSAASYTLQIASSGSFADAATIATQPGLTYTSTGLLASTTYYYRVGVTNSGLWSATKSATTTITAPITPTVVANTASGSTTWHWNAADCAAGTVGRYQYDYTTSGYDSGWLDTSNTSVNYTTATDGYTYTVQVKSKCYSTVTGTSSGWSGIGSANYYKPITTYVLTTIAGAGGTVSAGGTVNIGSSPTITATPNASYAFSNWSGDSGCSGAASHTITMDSNKSCTASFVSTMIATSSQTNATNVFPLTMDYNNNGYTGTLSKDGASTSASVQTGGSYTASDTKTVAASVTTLPGAAIPATYAYDTDSYVGTLDKSGAAIYISGTAGDSMSMSDGWCANYIPNNDWWDNGTYSGNLKLVSKTAGWDDWHKYCGFWSGTVYKPSTYVYTQNYSGSATKPAVDTRVYTTMYTQNYSGTVSK